jgi:peroxiredoxin
VAVSIDDRERQQMMIDRVREEHGIEIDYVLLTDTDHRVINRYGLFNPDEPKHRPVPHPAVYVIDKDGIVRWKLVEVNYRVRAENEDILAALADL